MLYRKKNNSGRDEILYMRKTAGNTWTDYETNTETARNYM
jgi:hypothetical protein